MQAQREHEFPGSRRVVQVTHTARGKYRTQGTGVMHGVIGIGGTTATAAPQHMFRVVVVELAQVAQSVINVLTETHHASPPAAMGIERYQLYRLSWQVSRYRQTTWQLGEALIELVSRGGLERRIGWRIRLRIGRLP